MATYTISINDPDEINKLEAFVKELRSANIHEKATVPKSLERIESVEALNKRIQKSREMVKAGLYLTEEELDKEIQQWLGEKL